MHLLHNVIRAVLLIDIEQVSAHGFERSSLPFLVWVSLASSKDLHSYWPFLLCIASSESKRTCLSSPTSLHLQPDKAPKWQIIVQAFTHVVWPSCLTGVLQFWRESSIMESAPGPVREQHLMSHGDAHVDSHKQPARYHGYRMGGHPIGLE